MGVYVFLICHTVGRGRTNIMWVGWCQFFREFVNRGSYGSINTSLFTNNGIDPETELKTLLDEIDSKHFNYPDINWDTNQCSSTASPKLFVECVENNHMAQHNPVFKDMTFFDIEYLKNGALRDKVTEEH